MGVKMCPVMQTSQEAKLWDGTAPLDWQKLVAPNMETFSGWDFSHFFQVDLELLSTCCSIWLTEFSCSLLTGARLNLTVLDLFRYVPAPTHSLPKAGGGFSFLSHAGYFPGLAPIPMYSTLRILDQAI